MLKVGFIGHRSFFDRNIRAKLLSAIESETVRGNFNFIMGTHGDFDRLALETCRKARAVDKRIEIEVVVTSLHELKRDKELGYNCYDDVKTVMFEIENEYFKRQITLSNRLMIDECCALICYVDLNAYRSGAKTAMRYAEKKGLRIINLCDKN